MNIRINRIIGSGVSIKTVLPMPLGESLFDSPGTFSWIAPEGVTSVSVVAVGGSSRGGGGLGWKNNISVVPGSSYTVTVGARSNNALIPAGDSFFISNSTVMGRGAGNGSSNANFGGTFVGDGGGSGGTASGLGGAGAGGYTGNGANSPAGTSPQPGLPGAGGGGGSGGIGAGGWPGGGGGVGVYGAGADGAGGTAVIPNTGGKGGSGGTDGTSANFSRGVGGQYGGGGGGGFDQSTTGRSGAVRIIWGTDRSFPNNAA